MLLAEGDIAVWVTGSIAVIVNALLTAAAMAITLWLAKRADGRQDLERDLAAARTQENVNTRLANLEGNMQKIQSVPQELATLKANQEHLLHSFEEFARRLEASVSQLFEITRAPGMIQTVTELSVLSEDYGKRLAIVEGTLKRCKTCAEAAAGGWPHEEKKQA